MGLMKMVENMLIKFSNTNDGFTEKYIRSEWKSLECDTEKKIRLKTSEASAKGILWTGSFLIKNITS